MVRPGTRDAPEAVIEFCLCRRNARYYNAFCVNRDAHEPWDGLDWYDKPVYLDRTSRDARQYRDQVLAGEVKILTSDTPPPETIGTPVDLESLRERGTIGRTRRAEPEPKREMPEPVMLAVELDEDHEPHLPSAAARTARTAHAAGWDVRITFAIGHEMNDNGTPRMNPVWRFYADEAGNERKTKIGETDPGPQPSVAVRALDRSRLGHPDAMFVGVWMGGRIVGGRWTGATFQTGMIMWPYRKVTATMFTSRLQAAAAR